MCAYIYIYIYTQSMKHQTLANIKHVSGQLVQELFAINMYVCIQYILLTYCAYDLQI